MLIHQTFLVSRDRQPARCNQSDSGRDCGPSHQQHGRACSSGWTTRGSGAARNGRIWAGPDSAVGDRLVSVCQAPQGALRSQRRRNRMGSGGGRYRLRSMAEIRRRSPADRLATCSTASTPLTSFTATRASRFRRCATNAMRRVPRRTSPQLTAIGSASAPAARSSGSSRGARWDGITRGCASSRVRKCLSGALGRPIPPTGRRCVTRASTTTQSRSMTRSRRSTSAKKRPCRPTRRNPRQPPRQRRPGPFRVLLRVPRLRALRLRALLLLHRLRRQLPPALLTTRAASDPLILLALAGLGLIALAVALWLISRPKDCDELGKRAKAAPGCL